jgi:hypothetical protein
MDFRVADMQDLSQLKVVYKDIIQNMNDNQIEIWDDLALDVMIELTFCQSNVNIML